MAEPTIVLQVNTGSEDTPTWATIDVAIRWTGPGGVGDPFPAPVGDADDAFFDAAAAPNDGELWHDTGADAQVTVAGRNANQNVFRALETGGTDPTADPPEFTAYDDATDGQNRTAPTVWILAGTAGSSSVSAVRAIETTNQAPGAPWTGQDHDTDPGDGTSNAPADLDGNNAGSKVTCTTVLAASGNKTFNLAACAPHDSTPGLTSFVYQLQYTYT